MTNFKEVFESHYTWIEGFMRNVRRLSNKQALVDPQSKRMWTYSEVNQEVNRLCHAFMKAGVKKGDVIMLHDIRYFVSENKLTYIVLNNGTSFNVDLTLTAIDAQLNPKRFMRVNRKYIVPVNMVDILERDINGKERLKLKPGKKNPEIIISRDNKQNVHNWIDGCTHPK